jgi:hypothetical protein
MDRDVVASIARWVDCARVAARDAFRALRTGRGTTLLAFSILTLTMAAGTIVFSVVDAVALRRLPYSSPERLVDLSLPGQTPGKPFRPSPQTAASASFTSAQPTISSRS